MTKNKSTLKLVKHLSNWMDSKFKIPGTDIRFGFDALIGLIPGLGDVATTGISIGIMGLAAKEGVPFKIALKMMGNIIIDAIISIIPFASFIFDVAFKANTRNLKLLEDHITHNTDGKYYFGIWILLGITALISLFIIIGLSALLFKAIGQIVEGMGF
ncbi:MAG: DUF4112 domain-containing protein [Chitinophagales bacterium]|nr:DUF4112 domain-containing protein [Chitinophagales bacterium]